MQHSGTPEPSAISKNSIAWPLDSLKKSQNQSPVTLDMATYGKSNTSHNQTCSEKEKKDGETVREWRNGLFWLSIKDRPTSNSNSETQSPLRIELTKT